MTHNELLIVGVSAVVVTYPIAMRLLANLAQPSRLQMAAIGSALLKRDDLAPFHRHMVNSMMDDAYDPRVMIFFSFALPVFVVRRMLGFIAKSDTLELPSGEVGDQIRRLSNLHTIAISAANPLFSLIIIVEAIAIGMLLAPYALYLLVFSGSFNLGGDTLELNTFASELSDKILGHPRHSVANLRAT